MLENCFYRPYDAGSSPAVATVYFGLLTDMTNSFIYDAFKMVTESEVMPMLNYNLLFILLFMWGMVVLAQLVRAGAVKTVF